MQSVERRTSRSRRRKLTLTSDSEDDTGTVEGDGSAQRRSSRIYGKQHKPEFRLPSRDTIWNDIPTVTTTSSLKRLTPKKTVNNFTKVYNKYNYDDYEDTSDDEDSSVETSDSGEEKKKQHRIKNYHKRLQVASSSSDEDDGKLDGSHRELLQTAECSLKDEVEPDSVAGLEVTCSELTGDSKVEVDHVAATAAAESEDSDASDVLSPSKIGHLRNRSVLVSDDDSAGNDDNCDEVGDDKFDEVGGDKDDNAGDSHNEQDDASDSSENDSPLESRRCTLEKQKLKQANMFQKLREAQAKRKKSVSKT